MLTDAPTTGPTSISNQETLIRQALGDRCELHEVVGRGSMATVYRAVQLKCEHESILSIKYFVLTTANFIKSSIFTQNRLWKN